jgi:glutaredoxin
VKTIVVTDNCPHCDQLKALLEKQGAEVEFINASTPEGRDFAIKNKIEAVPECLVITEGGKRVKVCSEEEFLKLIGEDV